MKITCPHCNRPVEVIEAGDSLDTSCPSCGSRIDVSGATCTYHQPTVDSVEGFEILQELGVGRFGRVWKALDKKLQRHVAIKVPRTAGLDDSVAATFVREARAAAQLSHPHIVAVYDVINDSDRILIVSQYIDGLALSDYLQSHRLPYDEVALLCKQLAEALHYAHDRGIVHRDLKPQNVLVDRDHRPYITDFGLAKRMADDTTTTLDGQMVGTPSYMSPEQARGKGKDADRRSDVFSLGVIMYEMLTGQRPFTGSMQSVLDQIIREDPRYPRLVEKHVPRDLATICMKALEKDPHRRYQSAREMADDLDRYTRGDSIVARPAPVWDRVSRSMRRQPVVFGSLATAAVCVGLAAWSVLVRPDNGPVRAGPTGAVSPKRTVSIGASNAGATFYFFPLDAHGGWPLVDERSIAVAAGESASLELRSGLYRVVTVLPDGEFHEVLRRVPFFGELQGTDFKHGRYTVDVQGVVQLAPVTIPRHSDVIATMAFVPGAVGHSVTADETPLPRKIPDFYLDPTEVTNASAAAILGIEAPNDAFPATNLTLGEMLEYAERAGKIVAPDTLLDYVMRNLGRSRYPSGELPPARDGWKLVPTNSETADVLPLDPPVRFLFSNALEMTDDRSLSALGQFTSLVAENWVFVRGGPASDAPGDLQIAMERGGAMRFAAPPDKPNPRIGLRCARSARPRLTADDFMLTP